MRKHGLCLSIFKAIKLQSIKNQFITKRPSLALSIKSPTKKKVGVVCSYLSVCFRIRFRFPLLRESVWVRSCGCRVR